MQDCAYVYEYRDPRNGRTMFVGHGKGLAAWLTADRALQGTKKRGAKGEADGLFWFLRQLIEDEQPVSALAPHIVGCFKTPTLAETEVQRRIGLYGLDNLLNGKSAPDAKGVDPLPVTNCGPGAVCEFQFIRLKHLETIPRQVGMFARFIPAVHRQWSVGGRWDQFAIVHDVGFIAEQRRAAAQVQPDEDKRPPDEYLIEYATRGINESLDQDTFNIERAKRFAGLLRELLKRNFLIIETNNDGVPLDFHAQPIYASQFSMAKKVMEDICNALRYAKAADLPAIWAKVDDGTFMRQNGAEVAEYDPDAPALPPPNHIPFDPGKRRPFKQFPPTPVMTKPSEDDPNLMGALARLAHLIQGGSPPPTNGVAMTHEEQEIERMRLG